MLASGCWRGQTENAKRHAKSRHAKSGVGKRFGRAKPENPKRGKVKRNREKSKSTAKSDRSKGREKSESAANRQKSKSQNREKYSVRLQVEKSKRRNVENDRKRPKSITTEEGENSTSVVKHDGDECFRGVRLTRRPSLAKSIHVLDTHLGVAENRGP